MGHVSPSPRFHPGRSDFPSPVGDPSISLRCLPWWAEAQALAHVHPALTRFTPQLDNLEATGLLGVNAPFRRLATARSMPRAPLPHRRVTPVRTASCAVSKSVTSSSSLIRAHASDQDPPTGSSSPRRWVLAGCCQPLLRDGPSRRYLCIPCVGAWTHAPGCHLCARARSFQRCNGHRPRCEELGPSNDPRKAASTGRPIFEAAVIH